MNFHTCLAAISIYTLSLTATDGEKPFKLVGTVEAQEGDSRALLEITGEPIGIYCSAGQECRLEKCSCEVGSATITHIGREHIWLKRGRERFRVEMGQPSDTALALKVEVPAATAPQPPAGHTQFWRTLLREIERTKITDSASAPEFRRSKARLVVDILFQSLGLRASDKIVKFQNTAFQANATWGTMVYLIANQREIFIETEREGKPMLFKIQVKD
jgi:hypothetical protein